jgi:hypothetical protein
MYAALSPAKEARLSNVRATGLSLAVALGCALVGDHLFTLPPGHLGSSTAWVWATGSDHGDILGRGGFNIWMLMGRDPHSSSHAPLLVWGPLTLSAARMGRALFVVATGAVTLFSGLALLRGLRAGEGPASRGRSAALLLACNGLVFLFMNLLVPGTHDRYMYLGYHTTLLAMACAIEWRLVTRWHAASAVVSACFFGVYLYSQVFRGNGGQWPESLAWLRSPGLLATLHGILLVALLDVWRALLRTSATESRAFTSAPAERMGGSRPTSA